MQEEEELLQEILIKMLNSSIYYDSEMPYIIASMKKENLNVCKLSISCLTHYILLFPEIIQRYSSELRYIMLLLRKNELVETIFTFFTAYSTKLDSNGDKLFSIIPFIEKSNIVDIVHAILFFRAVNRNSNALLYSDLAKNLEILIPLTLNSNTELVQIIFRIYSLYISQLTDLKPDIFIKNTFAKFDKLSDNRIALEHIKCLKNIIKSNKEAFSFFKYFTVKYVAYLKSGYSQDNQKMFEEILKIYENFNEKPSFYNEIAPIGYTMPQNYNPNVNQSSVSSFYENVAKFNSDLQQISNQIDSASNKSVSQDKSQNSQVSTTSQQKPDTLPDAMHQNTSQSMPASSFPLSSQKSQESSKQSQNSSKYASQASSNTQIEPIVVKSIEDIVDELNVFNKMSTKDFLESMPKLKVSLDQISEEDYDDQKIISTVAVTMKRVMTFYKFLSIKTSDIYQSNEILNNFKINVNLNGAIHRFTFNFDDCFIWLSYKLNTINFSAHANQTPQNQRRFAMQFFLENDKQSYTYKYGKRTFTELQSIISAVTICLHSKKYTDDNILEFTAIPVVISNGLSKMDIVMHKPNSHSLQMKLSDKIAAIDDLYKLCKHICKQNIEPSELMEKVNKMVNTNGQALHLDVSVDAKFILTHRFIPLETRLFIARSLCRQINRMNQNIKVPFPATSDDLVEKVFLNAGVLMYIDDVPFSLNKTTLTKQQFFSQFTQEFKRVSNPLKLDYKRVGIIIALSFLLDCKTHLKFDVQFYKSMKKEKGIDKEIIEQFKKGVTTGIPYDIFCSFSAKEMVSIFQI